MEVATRVRSRPVVSGFARIAKVLRVAADERRLRILGALMKKELCVCELVDSLLLAQYEVSRHLARLKQVGLVVDRREGLWAYYSIPKSAWQDPLLGGFLAMVEQELAGAYQAKGDSARLEKRLAMRNGDRCVVGFKN
jgi:ArsR family transcriptional regulator